MKLGLTPATLRVLSIAISLLLPGELPPPQSQKTERGLFGVNLRPEAVRLLNDVERRVGKPVRGEVIGTLGWGIGGVSTILEDGTPVIRLIKSLEKDETTIVHELCHLKMDLFESVVWKLSPAASYNIDEALLDKLNLRLLNSISHWKFYPEMRAMGYDPDEMDRSNLEAIIKMSPQDALTALGIDSQLISLIYVTSSLEISDRNLVAKLEDWYKKNDLETQLDLAKNLLRVIEGTRTNAVERQASTFVRCLNILLKDLVQFKITKMETEMRGSFSTRVVTIEIVEPKSGS